LGSDGSSKMQINIKNQCAAVHSTDGVVLLL
jgi:hypothetical protein